MSEQSEKDDRDVALRAVVEAARGSMSDTEWRLAKLEPLTTYSIFADAIIAAGFRRPPAPQQVSTVEELDALPVGAVIMSADGVPFHAVFRTQAVNYWEGTGEVGDLASRLIRARVVDAGVEPVFTVLYRPEGGEA